MMATFKKRGGIGMTMRAYEKKGKMIVQVGNVAAVVGGFKRKAEKKKSPSSKPRK